MNEEGLPAKRTAEYTLGSPSLYTRGRNTPAITSRTRGARLSGYAYDDVYHRLFVRDYTEIAWDPHGRVLVFDVHPDRIKNGAEAIAVIGQPDFTSFAEGGIGRRKMGSIDQEALDQKNQRLFITDRANNRVMVWDVHPDRLTATPEAMAVLGQPDFVSREPGRGPAGFNRPGDLYYDEKTDRLFVVDSGNNRVLVFDASPEKFRAGMAASEVLGQPGFESTSAGTAADRFTAPSGIAYDRRFDRLFIVDGGRGPRLLVFNGSPGALRTGAKAIHVLGQASFTSREPRANPKKWGQGLLLDETSQRLFANESDRMLVFDIHPGRLTDNPDASNLMFTEDWEENFGPDVVRGLGMVSRTRETSVKAPMIDEETQKMYTAASYTGRNAVSIWDISAGNMKEVATPVRDVLGQYDWAGNVDFTSRAANGRVNDRFLYPRGTTLDSVDHRLFVNDQYLHRILVFNLDDENRPLDREADIVLGQPGGYTGEIRPPSARDFNVPLALAYDPAGKYLFVADGGNNRIMVFDADPARLKTYDDAIAVIGQRDFASRSRELSARGIDFGVAFGRGITSAAPLPMGFTVDPKRRRLFVSDGVNHRVLVFNIGPDQIRTGMAAAAVIGQPDFQSNRPRADARGFNTPSDLAYDADRDLLFAVDGNNNRVLVFRAAPEDIRPDQQAIAVLGQEDFTSVEQVRLDTAKVSEDVGRRIMRMPSGLAYDPVLRELYVNDKGNDRVLIFDAAPDKLRTGMAAKGVIGQPDFVTRLPGDGEQEQLLDPRQLAFDANNRRLYVTDSFWGRLMMFDLPRSERLVSLPAHGMKTYGTLDAWNGRPQPDTPRLGMPSEDVRQVWRALLEGDRGAPGAALVYHTTRQELDPMSLRRSRVLISETSVPAPAPQPSSLFFVSEDDGYDSRVIVSNPNSAVARVVFRLQLGAERFEVSRTLGPGAQIESTMSELFGREIRGAGALRVAGEGAEVSSLVLYRTLTDRREELLLAGVGGAAPEAGATVALAGLKWGGGYRSELILLNPHEKPVQGTVAFFDREGAAVNVAGGAGRIPYEIAPNGVFRWTRESGAAWAQEAYAVIEGGGPLPSGGAIVSLWRGSLLVTQSSVPVRPATHHAWTAVDTLPSLIRHGRSRLSFTIANPTRTPALLRFTLFDNSGLEKGRSEQLLPPHMEREWTLADLFNLQAFQGSVRLWSDVEVAVNAKRTTETLRHEPVENHISYVTEEQLQGRGRVELPAILDGQGIATEIVLTNPGSAAIEAGWRFLSAEGQPREIVLR